MDPHVSLLESWCVLPTVAPDPPQARLAADAKRSRIAARIKSLEDAEAQRKKEADARHLREIERRMHPRTTEDFEILYNELENWRFHETKRIKEAAMGPEARRKALAELLHKETKLLQTVRCCPALAY